MLSENLINQFTSDCPSTRILLTKAWPSLSVESKLQLLDTLKNRHPSWLSIIALDDKDEIVKLWALKNIGVSLDEEDKLNDSMHQSNLKIFGEDAYTLHKKIKADKNEIVNKFIRGDLVSYLFFEDFPSISQETRLIRLRFIDIFDTVLFIDNIEMLVSNLKKNDLAECLDEIAGNINNYSFTIDNDIEKLNKAWMLISNLDEDLSYRFAKILPICTQYTNIKRKITNGSEVIAETFLQLPPLAMCWLLKTNKDNPSNELLRLVKIIINDSDKFDGYIIRAALEINFEEEPASSQTKPILKESFFSKLKLLISN